MPKPRPSPQWPRKGTCADPLPDSVRQEIIGLTWLDPDGDRAEALIEIVESYLCAPVDGDSGYLLSQTWPRPRQREAPLDAVSAKARDLMLALGELDLESALALKMDNDVLQGLFVSLVALRARARVAIRELGASKPRDPGGHVRLLAQLLAITFDKHHAVEDRAIVDRNRREFVSATLIKGGLVPPERRAWIERVCTHPIDASAQVRELKEFTELLPPNVPLMALLGAFSEQGRKHD